MSRLTLFLSCIASILVLFNGCREQQDKYQVVTNRIQYDVPVVSSDPQLDWWVNNLEGSRREPFIRRILDAARNGNVKAYDYFNQPLTPEEVRRAGNDTVARTFVRNFPPYEQYDTMVVFRTDYEDIVKLRFMEEWTWDPATLEFVKKVVGICPLAEIQVGEAVYNRPLFWIYLDERYPGILEGDQ